MTADRPLTLTARLVAVAVLLVAVTAFAIATATTLAMRQGLDDRLDQQLEDSLYRTVHGPEGPRGDGPGVDLARDLLQQDDGAFIALFVDDEDPNGGIRGDRTKESWGSVEPMSDDQLDALRDVLSDRDPVTASLPDLGSYRIASYEADDRWIAYGLPREEVDRTVADLVRLELLATLLGVLAAAGVGTWVVRRQLAPLREVSATAHRVAELPLASGAIEISERVPERLTDERTEIGQVGAALNTMLDHVEASLGQRHRSEQQVRQFVADASHELRTPLATIAGYTELARRRPETTSTALDKVETESARMTGLVEDLLLLARLDAGRPLDRTPVDLSRLLLEAVNDARVVDPDHQWRLSLPDAPVTVSGDEARLLPGRHQPADQRAQAHPRREHRHGDRHRARVHRPRRRTGHPARASPRVPSSASSAATPPAPASVGPASASPWSRRSSRPTAARSP